MWGVKERQGGFQGFGLEKLCRQWGPLLSENKGGRDRIWGGVRNCAIGLLSWRCLLITKGGRRQKRWSSGESSGLYIDCWDMGQGCSGRSGCPERGPATLSPSFHFPSSSLPPPPLPQVYTRYGKCYTFNADPQSSLPSRAGGMGSGLEIMLDIQQEEYLPIWRETSMQAGEGQGRPGDCSLGRLPGMAFQRSLPISPVQTRHRLRLASGCRSTAKRSHPTFTSWALACLQASRHLCPARNSG